MLPILYPSLNSFWTFVFVLLYKFIYLSIYFNSRNNISISLCLPPNSTKVISTFRVIFWL